jgi:hypothetical protein
MKIFLYVLALLLLGGSWAVEIPLKGQAEGRGKTTKSA